MNVKITLDRNAIDCLKGIYGEENHDAILAVITSSIKKAINSHKLSEVFFIITDEEYRGDDH